MSANEGGCLCGGIRYRTTANPTRVTFCHCRFCQRATGSAYLVETVFQRDDLEIVKGSPTTYDHRSEGSGKLVTINFCANCGTKIYFGFERFPDVIGIFGGTFDNPNWYERTPENSKHIFLEVAQHGTIIPPRFNTYLQHANHNDGTPVESMIFEKPHTIGIETSD